MCALKGHIVTEETRQKLRDANLGKRYSLEVNKKKGSPSNKHMLGKKHSPETRRQMSVSHTGLKATESQIRALLGNKRRLGLLHTQETKLKMRASARKGASNPMWKGGVTPINRAIRTSHQYKEWRMSVYRRDKFKCRDCGSKMTKKNKLDAHHIKPFSLHPELRFEVSNGRTLCVPCHKNTDTYAWKMRRTSSIQ